MNIKKTPYKILIGFIALILISLISFIIYFYLMLNYEERLTERLTDDVIVINDLLSSMYLVRVDSTYLAIDTGFFDSFLERGLEYNNILPDEIKYIFLTHSDADHVNNIKLFKSAKVFFPKEEKEMLDNKRQRFTFLPFYSNEIDLANYNLIQEGDSVMLGNRKIKFISLPGHTKGSMGFIVDDKYLFSGDAFRLKNGKISVPFRKYFVTSENKMLETIHKVSKLDSIKYIFTAHSGFTADFQFAISK